METIIAATAGVAELFMRPNDLGKIQRGFLADCILVDGNPLEDITILQDHGRLNVVVINGRVHKASPREIYGDRGLGGTAFPEVEREWQVRV